MKMLSDSHIALINVEHDDAARNFNYTLDNKRTKSNYLKGQIGLKILKFK